MHGAAAETTATGASKAAGMHAAATAAMEATAAATTTASAAASAAMTSRHRAGRHTCCKGHGHRTCDKLFPHRNLLQFVSSPIDAGRLTAEEIEWLRPIRATCTTIRYD
jgi:hypothetical protein